MSDDLPSTREDLKLLMRETVADALNQYFSNHGMKAEHWVYIRLQYEQQKNDWSLVRRVVIGTILTGALLFAGKAAYDSLMAKVIADTQRRGESSAPQRTGVIQ